MRYFDVAAANHHADEEATLVPRLRSVRPDLVPLCAEIEREHLVLGRGWLRLRPRLAAIAVGRSGYLPIREVEAFRAGYEQHIGKEEEPLASARARRARPGDARRDRRGNGGAAKPLDREQRAHVVRVHVGAAPARTISPRDMHDVLVGERLARSRSTARPAGSPSRRSLASVRIARSMSLMIDGWMPSVGSSRISSFGSHRERAADRELLLLAAGQIAAAPPEHVLQHREHLEDVRGHAVRCACASRVPSRRFSSTVRRGKISRPCGT